MLKKKPVNIALIEIALIGCGVEFTEEESWNGGTIIRFPWCSGDIAYHKDTYGYPDYVETFRFPWDNEDVSILYPDEAVRKIVAYYMEVGEPV